MFRLSKPFGLISGITLGIFTRDNYVYPYPIRVQDLQEDFQKINENMGKRIIQQEEIIAKLSIQLEEAQGVYITKKHILQEGQIINSQENINPKPNINPNINSKVLEK